MTAEQHSNDGLLLVGLDGSNPLAFLAALGTLRTLTQAWPERHVSMSWEMSEGAWRPRLRCPYTETAESILQTLHRTLCLGGTPEVQKRADRLRARSRNSADIIRRAASRWKKQGLPKAQQKDRKAVLGQAAAQRRKKWLALSAPHLLIGTDTNLTCQDFARYLKRYLQMTSGQRLLDDLAALGTDLPDEDGLMSDTALRTMRGAGHQHLLTFMANILEQVEAADIRKALFFPWVYDDPVKNLTLRLDPSDDVRYALRWRNPSGDPAREDSGSVLGANALAIAGFALMPVIPSADGVTTVGFSGRRASDTRLSWPIWVHPISLDTCGSLLALPQLQKERPNHRELIALGIAQVHRSRRITTGKFRNFSPAQAI